LDADLAETMSAGELDGLKKHIQAYWAQKVHRNGSATCNTLVCSH